MGVPISQLESSQCWEKGSVYWKSLLPLPLIYDLDAFLEFDVIHPQARMHPPHPTSPRNTVKRKTAEGCLCLGLGSVCTDPGGDASGIAAPTFQMRM